MTANLIANPLTDCQPGDVLLFNRDGVYNKVIRVKTWSRFTHCENAIVQTGFRMRTFASRNGDGVNLYKPNLDGLALVLRSSLAFNQEAALAWAKTVIGQKYDWLGLLAFFFAKFQGQDNGAMFCSEACTRFLRAGGIDLFAGADADTISPRDFSVNPNLTIVWRSADEWQRINQKDEAA